jgi:mannose-6-phosphate isomerase-like protein (cupin superfamily)
MPDEIQLIEQGRPRTPYEVFMEEEGIPVYGGVGARDVRDLALGPWKRMGARGAFMNLDGIQAGGTGFYVLEIPPAAAVNPEKHVYEELFYVVEGRGTTEVWREADTSRKQVFEWQQGSLFAIPLNTCHRLVNATGGPAVLIGATTAPPMINMLHSRRFIFDNYFDFTERYDGRDDFFKAKPQIATNEFKRSAVYVANVIPDMRTSEMPERTTRGTGYRHVDLEMADNSLTGHVGEFPSGRYSRAHAHQSGAVLICIKGEGYSISWPMDIGTRPWEVGKGDQVKRQDYVPGGMVSAAPGGADWFHQHFGVGREPLRYIAVRYGGSMKWSMPHADEEAFRLLHVNVRQGGRTISYAEEDPLVRKMYIEVLQQEGIEFAMPQEVYA